jgi:hypothetical protein
MIKFLGNLIGFLICIFIIILAFATLIVLVKFILLLAFLYLIYLIFIKDGGMVGNGRRN